MHQPNDLWRNIQRELMRAQDLETVVLKGHLLIETQLNAALEARIGPDVENVRLTFAQKLDLVACLSPWLTRGSGPGSRSLHKDWKQFNALRNKIAHQLSLSQTRGLLADWVSATLGYRLRTIKRTTVLKSNLVKALARDLAYFSGRILQWKMSSKG